MAEETEERLFFGCPYAQCMWRGSGISNSVINNHSKKRLKHAYKYVLRYASSRSTFLDSMALMEE